MPADIKQKNCRVVRLTETDSCRHRNGSPVNSGAFYSTLAYGTGKPARKRQKLKVRLRESRLMSVSQEPAGKVAQNYVPLATFRRCQHKTDEEEVTMVSGATPWRESLIRLIALRLRYRRACLNPSVSATFLTSMLSEIEDAERDMARLEEK
jgi:hypothetical protein